MTLAVYDVLDAAGATAPTTPFKTDNVRLLVARTSPSSLAVAWQACAPPAGSPS